MQKVITLFRRDYKETMLVYDELSEGAEWVVQGEGRATEKIDGTSCLIRDGKLYKRYDAKRGKQPPANFEPSQEPDLVTGHWPGWVPISESDSGDKWHREAWDNGGNKLPNGTYELVGPKVQGNRYKLNEHRFRLHGDVALENVPTNFTDLRDYLECHLNYEGVVWHHPDGRLVKIKRRDFGFRW